MIDEKRNADELLIDAIVLKAIETTGDIDISHEEEEAKAALNELDLQLIHNETKKAVQRYATQQRRKKVRRNIARIAACILIAFMSISLPVLSVKAVRDRVIEFLVIKFDQFALLPPAAVVGSESVNIRVEPSWLPDPYQHRQVIIDDSSLTLIYYYDDTGENFISFQVNYAPSQTAINIEDAETKQYKNGNITIFVSERSDETILVALDHQTGYQYTIGGKHLSQEEISKIFESIKEFE